MPRRIRTTPPPYVPPEQSNPINLNDVGKTPQLVGELSDIRTTTSSTTTTLPPPPNLISPIAPNGLDFTANAHLSNGNFSRQVTGAAGINDFSIFNDYIHYTNTSAVVRFNPRNLLEQAVTKFEIYRQQFRN